MTFPVIHFNVTPAQRGYFKVRPQVACGLETQLDEQELEDVIRTSTPFFSQVNCDWCRVATNRGNKHVVDDRGMSAHDTQKAITVGVEDGVAQSVARISKDFQEAREPLKLLVADGVEFALQRSSVRTNLVGIHKIAEDEIDAEWDESGRDDEIAEDRQREIKDALREVLEEAAPGQTGAGVGTTFNQTVVSPASLTPHDVYEAVREAIADDEDETLEDYEEHETALMQKAVTSIVTSDEFQALFKKLVKEAVEEKKLEDQRREIDWNLLWYDSIFTKPRHHNEHKVSTELQYTGDVVEGSGISDQTPLLVHHRRLYTARTSCGLPGGSLKTDFRPSKANCVDCDAALNKN